jgi:dynein heavy chain
MVGSGKDKVADYWETGKKKVLTADLLKNCQNFDKDNMDPAIIDSLKPILASEEYEDSKLANASKAAHGLSKWVRAMV